MNDGPHSSPDFFWNWRGKTGCTIVAVEADGAMHINPDPGLVLPSDADLVLIGTAKAEDKLLKHLGDELP